MFLLVFSSSSDEAQENDLQDAAEDDEDDDDNFPKLYQTQNKCESASDNITELGHRNTKFAFDLFKHLTRSEGQKNHMISPFSVSMLLSLVNLGSNGETKEELIKTLHYEGFEDKIEETYQELLAEYIFPSRKALKVANALFSSNKFKLNSRFVEDVKTFFNGQSSEMNFSGNPRKSEKEINKWIKDATNDLIKEAVPTGTIDSTMLLLLVNTIYLKTNWDKKFKIMEDLKPFHLNEKKTVDVKMMKIEKFANYANVEEHGFHIVEIPLKGRHAAMYFIVPHQVAGLDDVIDSIDSDIIIDVIDNKMKGVMLTLQMPMFSFDYDLELKDILKTLGIRKLFSPTKADLSKMLQSDPDLRDLEDKEENSRKEKMADGGFHGYCVDKVAHKTHISVNEEGLEAAATTWAIVQMSATIYPPPEVTLVLDRPFSFFIRGNVTKTTFFMGSVYDPTAKNGEKQTVHEEL